MGSYKNLCTTPMILSGKGKGKGKGKGEARQGNHKEIWVMMERLVHLVQRMRGISCSLWGVVLEVQGTGKKVEELLRAGEGR